MQSLRDGDVTTTLRQFERLTRRLTIWQRSPAGWRILYHQGTIVSDAGSPLGSQAPR